MLENNLLNPIAIIGVTILIVIAIIILIVTTCYIKAPPNKVAVITGIRKKPKVLVGKAGIKIPFLERVDWLKIGQIDIDINTEDYIPTNDFIDIEVDAIAQVAINTEDEPIQIAMKNFLNNSSEEIKNTISKSLQGNLREIIGTMSLKDIVQNKAKFSQEVKANAEEDMSRLGIKILSFNVQNIVDKNGLIEDLGIDNTSQIKKGAAIAKANAERDIKIASAEAMNRADEAKVQAELAIAKRNNELEIKKAELKIAEDTQKAAADVAYEIQKQTSRKTLEIREQEADIARREKEIILQQKEAEVTEKKLDAEIRKKAEAEKYAQQQLAEADLYKRQKLSDAKLYEQQKDAEAQKSEADATKYRMEQEAKGIEAKGLAEAKSIEAKGLAEAEALDKKAEAMKKYGQAAVAEMYFDMLPKAVEAASKPLEKVDKITMYGEGNQTKLISDIVNTATQVNEGINESMGIDLKSLLVGILGTKAFDKLDETNESEE